MPDSHSTLITDLKTYRTAKAEDLPPIIRDLVEVIAFGTVFPHVEDCYILKREHLDKHNFSGEDAKYALKLAAFMDTFHIDWVLIKANQVE